MFPVDFHSMGERNTMEVNGVHQLVGPYFVFKKSSFDDRISIFKVRSKNNEMCIVFKLIFKCKIAYKLIYRHNLKPWPIAGNVVTLDGLSCQFEL